MSKYYGPTQPRDLSRPRARDKKPANPEMLLAFHRALFTRSEA